MVVAYLKGKMKGSIGWGSIVSTLGVRMLGIPIPQTLTHHSP